MPAKKRRYVSETRERAAERTRQRVLDAARHLFSRKGVDGVTIAQIAKRAKVSVPTVYALHRSKAGILRAIMESALFGPEFQAARARLAGVTDPVELIALSAQVARAIYESESTALGMLRGVSGFSPALRDVEREFETVRYEMQEARLRLLYAQSRAKQGLSLDKARRILWMYTSRDVYRMLVQEGGWTADEYEEWLAETLVGALVA
jgi:AcrR family transcriptional regulator